jgi:ABC-type nitrate/sulfonate/bicarbonate transport system substrate-binding protein
LNYSKKIKILFLLIILLSQTLFAKELKKVTLQLSWLNQFQFAGYYMAKEKGFYEELGLDVEIKPFEFGIDIPKDVNDGKIDFAVGRETLILERIKNPNIVALYALFQSTPLILMSTKESGINHINDFSNKRIMTTIDDASEVSLKAMIASNKIKLENLTFLKHTHHIDDLINKNTDVISAYISKSPYILQEKGVEYNIFDPKKYDFDMYSDMLYTNQNLFYTQLIAIY